MNEPMLGYFVYHRPHWWSLLPRWVLIESFVDVYIKADLGFDGYQFVDSDEMIYG